MQLGFTKEAGKIDQNDRIFNEIKDKYNQSFKKDTSSFAKKDFDIYQRIIILNRYCPKNAAYIMNALTESKNDVEARRMLDAVEMYLFKNKRYRAEISKYRKSKYKNLPKTIKGSVFDWMVYLLMLEVLRVN